MILLSLTRLPMAQRIHRNSKLHILQWNCRSLAARIYDLEGLLASLPGHSDILGYGMASEGRGDGDGVGGVAIYVINTLRFSIISLAHISHLLTPFRINLILIQVHFSPTSPLYVVSLYCPPSSSLSFSSFNFWFLSSSLLLFREVPTTFPLW